jgi:hypothetical protein
MVSTDITFITSFMNIRLEVDRVNRSVDMTQWQQTRALTFRSAFSSVGDSLASRHMDPNCLSMQPVPNPEQQYKCKQRLVWTTLKLPLFLVATTVLTLLSALFPGILPLVCLWRLPGRKGRPDITITGISSHAQQQCCVQCLTRFSHRSNRQTSLFTLQSTTKCVIIYSKYNAMLVSPVAQSVWCLAGLGWTTGRSRFDPRQRRKDFPLASVSKPALGPTQPPVQWVPGVLSPRQKRGGGVTMTTHRHLVPRSRMSRSYTSSPNKRLRILQPYSQNINFNGCSAAYHVEVNRRFRGAYGLPH